MDTLSKDGFDKWLVKALKHILGIDNYVSIYSYIRSNSRPTKVIPLAYLY